MEKPQIIGHISKSLSLTLYGALWLPGTSKVAVLGGYARGTGGVLLYDLAKTDLTLISEWEKPKSIRCGTFAGSDTLNNSLATGDMDGGLSVWNIEKGGSPLYRVKAHNGVINAIDGVGGAGVGDGAAELATGGRDGCVRIWDQRQKDEPVASMDPGEGETGRDCWSVSFGHAYNVHDRCVCAGYDNGDVKLFDLRAMKIRWETNLKNGVCSVQFDRKDISMNKLVATTLEGGVHAFDLRTQHPKKGFASVTEKAHGSTVWSVQHLPSNRDIFMTTGGSGSLNLWKYHYPSSRTTKDSEEVMSGVAGSLELLQNITMSTQPISSFDWCKDKAGLAVCTSFDQTLRVLIVTKLNTL